MFSRSPETTACGMLALMGMVLVIVGAVFDLEQVLTAGLGAVSLATGILGILARSERQHREDAQQVKADIHEAKQVVKEEIVEQVKDQVKAEITEDLRERRP